MIYIKKGQRLFEDTGLVVSSPTGYYNDGDVVLCATHYNPEESVCGYEAKFIAYGGIVYAISNPEELLEKIKEIDPNTLFGKDSQQVAVDKVVDDIVPQNTDQITESETKTEDTTPTDNVEAPSNEPTVTPPEEILPENTTSTTTAPSITQEEVVPPIDTPISSTPLEISTTTDQIENQVIDTASTTPTITPPEDIMSPLETSTTTQIIEATQNSKKSSFFSKSNAKKIKKIIT